tara:strand:+ start:113 stop:1252 length:1140 start_codon:yes stop_codon:yes gene_type:complete
MRQQITSTVTRQYKQETKHRNIRYTIKENFDQYPEVKEDYLKWRSKQNPVQQATFAGIFHPEYTQSMFDIRKAEIREDWGQRNALLEKGRKPKILGMAKNFDPQLFEPISVDYIADKDAYIIRDGGGRAHAAYLCGIYDVPATVRYLKSYKESRRLFNAQDKYATSISSYDKFLQQLLNKDHLRHNVAKDMWSIAKSSAFSLHHSSKSNSTPLVEGIGVLQKIISTVGGDNKNVKPGERSAPNLCMAVDLIKHAFPDADEIPASLLYGLTSYIHVSRNRIPSGDEGIKRFKQFVVDIRNSNEELKDLNRWASYMHFGAGQDIPKMAAASLMEKWNELYKNKNKGRSKATYRWVKWETQEINIAKGNIMQFARDESLLPD